MGNIDQFNKQDLLYVLNCMGVDVYISDDNLVVCGKDLYFVKKVDELFFNDLVDMGINVSDSRYVYYLLEIARSNSKKKSLKL